MGYFEDSNRFAQRRNRAKGPFWDGHGLSDHPFVRPGLFQFTNHLLGGDGTRIIIHGIDLVEMVPSARHFLHTGQPVQDCFAHVVSGHGKHDLRGGAGMGSGGKQNRRYDRNAQGQCKGQNR